MMRNEKGITLIGFLVVAIFLGLFALATIKLIPVYLEYGKVQSSLEKTKTELDGKSPSVADIYQQLENRWNIEDIRRVDFKEVKVTREPRSFKVRAMYEARVYYIGNIYLVAEFDKSVDILR
ncbi:MAG: DUF4845 domain-containing protein [Gammaproteobacteria bacterium]|jgi:hypothetical protein|nr:MAG: DUF4845 domain-containing protein [Gammaproteobacteria bacterium]